MKKTKKLFADPKKITFQDNFYTKIMGVAPVEVETPLSPLVKPKKKKLKYSGTVALPELGRSQGLLREKVVKEDPSLKGKYSTKVFGRHPNQQVEVKFETVNDPMLMMTDGMEEFIINAKLINYGEKESIDKLIHQAVLGSKDNINRKVFSQNLEGRIARLKRDLGIDIRKMIIQLKQQREKEEERG